VAQTKEARLCMIILSIEGFGISRSIHIEVLYDAIPLEGVCKRVTRVANNVCLSTTCSFCMYDSPTTDLCVE
jgi:hypothetical protein